VASARNQPDNMSKKSATKPDDNECFYCLKQGCCEVTISFNNSKRKPVNFCGQVCAEAFIHEDIVPRNLETNEKALKTLVMLTEEVKADPKLWMFKKVVAIEKMVRSSLATRKPKAEIQRLYTLWKECATETLQQISDVEDIEDNLVLRWADIMKSHDKAFPSLIQSLGR